MDIKRHVTYGTSRAGDLEEPAVLISHAAAKAHRSMAVQLLVTPAFGKARKLVSALFLVYVAVFGVVVGLDAGYAVHGVTGAAFGIVSCSVVLYHAAVQPGTRRHPNTLLLWRTGVDLVISARFLWNPVLHRAHGDDCLWPSFVLQVLELASEGWLFCVTLDLYKTLSNPFTSYSYNMRWVYHPLVWTLAVASGLVLVGTDSYGSYMNGKATSGTDPDLSWCWISQSRSANLFDFNGTSWLLFYVPMIVIYASSVVMLVWAGHRLNTGLQRTQQSRVIVLVNNTINLAVCLLFWLAVWIAYLLFFTRHRAVYKRIVLFLSSSKGISDLMIWIIVNEFSPMGSDPRPQANKALVHEVLHYATLGVRTAIQTPDALALELEELDHQRMRLGEFFDQLLLGRLYRQRGALEAIAEEAARERAEGDSSEGEGQGEAQGQGEDQGEEGARPVARSRATVLDPAHVATLGSVTFRIVCPRAFRRVRDVFGIADDDLCAALEKPIKERISEGGASNALFFFSSDERFIVKSMTLAEMKFWKRPTTSETGLGQSMADCYASYLEAHPGSFLCRVYGVYSLVLYGIQLHFFVMENLFKDRDVIIHERYDLKGSWVDRHTNPPREGEEVTCRHCNRKYTYTRASIVRARTFSASLSPARGAVDEPVMDACTFARTHQPRLVFKDNDLKFRLRLRDVRAVVQQLDTDSDFLSSVFGTMDYSLLVGVHKEVQSVRGSQRPGALMASEAHVPFSYYLCIIDMLQRWTLRKRFEAWWKVWVLRKDRTGLSSCPPAQYRSRFQHALRQFTNYPDVAAPALEDE